MQTGQPRVEPSKLTRNADRLALSSYRSSSPPPSALLAPSSSLTTASRRAPVSPPSPSAKPPTRPRPTVTTTAASSTAVGLFFHFPSLSLAFSAVRRLSYSGGRKRERTTFADRSDARNACCRLAANSLDSDGYSSTQTQQTRSTTSRISRGQNGWIPRRSTQRWFDE